MIWIACDTHLVPVLLDAPFCSRGEMLESDQQEPIVGRVCDCKLGNPSREENYLGYLTPARSLISHRL